MNDIAKILNDTAIKKKYSKPTTDLLFAARDEIERLQEDKLDALASIESENAFYQMEIKRLLEEIDQINADLDNP